MSGGIDLSRDQLSQGLHMALGGLFVTLPICWGWVHPALFGSLVGLIYAIVKEFVWDIWNEDDQTSGDWSGGFRDFCFYVVGIVLANVLVIL